MRPLPDLPSGVYRHYKGPLYLVQGYGHDANADDLWDRTAGRALTGPGGERIVVVYVGLQLDGAHTGPRLAVRTADDFHAAVCVNPHCGHYGEATTHHADACVYCGRPSRPRFEYVGPSWEGDR